MPAKQCPKCGSARIQRGFSDAPLVLRLFGVHDLLCNNCDTEFRGFALPGSVARSRQHKVEIGARRDPKERRRAQRYAVRIPVSVQLLDAPSAAHTPVLDGYTRNLSLLGLAVVLPAARFSDKDLAGERHRVRVQLKVEPRFVALDATIVRYEQLDEEDARAGWLIGLRITRISEAERASFAKFLNTFNAG